MLKPYTATCPSCGQKYVEEAHIKPDDPDRCCPNCCVKETGLFDPKWFLRNPCPYPTGSVERMMICSARADVELPIKIDGDNEEYVRKLAKNVVSKRRSSRSEIERRTSNKKARIQPTIPNESEDASPAEASAPVDLSDDGSEDESYLIFGKRSFDDGEED